MLEEIVNKYTNDDKSIEKTLASSVNDNTVFTADIIIMILDKMIDIISVINSHKEKLFIIEMPKKFDFDKFVKEVNADEIDVYRNHRAKEKVYYTVVKA